jgi:hypothetical protein
MEGYWVGPFWYDVIERGDAEMKEDVGNSVWWEHEIWLRKDLKRDVRARILMHEIMETMNEAYGWKLDHHVLDAIGNSFIELLKANCGFLPGVVDAEDE